MSQAPWVPAFAVCGALVVVFLGSWGYAKVRSRLSRRRKY